jgi:hypothetical protein
LEAAASGVLPLCNGAFEDAEDEGIDVVEEFFPVAEDAHVRHGSSVVEAMIPNR